MGGGGGMCKKILAKVPYSYICVLPNKFLLTSLVKSINFEETPWAEHEYMNIHSSPNYHSTYGPASSPNITLPMALPPPLQCKLTSEVSSIATGAMSKLF